MNITLSTPVYSTHVVDYGEGKISELAIVCGNYYRPFRKFVFGGSHELLSWMCLPVGATLIPCASPMLERTSSGMLNTSDNL